MQLCQTRVFGCPRYGDPLPRQHQYLSAPVVSENSQQHPQHLSALSESFQRIIKVPSYSYSYHLDELPHMGSDIK